MKEVIRSVVIPEQVRSALNHGERFRDYEEFTQVTTQKLTDGVLQLTALSPGHQEKALKEITRASEKRREEEERRERETWGYNSPSISHLALPDELEMTIARLANSVGLSPNNFIVELLSR